MNYAGISNNLKWDPKCAAWYRNIIFTNYLREKVMLKELQKLENMNKWYNKLFTDEEIEQSVKNARPDAAPAPDLVYNKTIKEIWGVPLAKAFGKMFNAVWVKMFSPPVWSRGTITPVPKPKEQDKTHPKANRPIAMIPGLEKLFEYIPKTRLIKHFEEERLITNHQHGFRSGEGCEELLFYLFKKIDQVLKERRKGIDNKIIKGIHALFYDFSKAFDTTWTPGMLYILYELGVRGRLYFWLKSYLENRTQVVKVGNEISKPIKVRNGIPQGSLIGPPLFSVFINGDLRLVKKRLVTFAFHMNEI